MTKVIKFVILAITFSLAISAHAGEAFVWSMWKI